jgi:hypothetical protein
LKTTTWSIPKELDESAVLHNFLDRVVNVEGNWERAFGGVLILHLPPDKEGTIVDDVNALLRPFQTANAQLTRQNSIRSQNGPVE